MSHRFIKKSIILSNDLELETRFFIIVADQSSSELVLSSLREL
jgi:hypothetical protein